MKYLLLLFFCATQFCFSQSVSRKLIQGKVVSDSSKVEDVVVFNVNSKIGKTINPAGFFELLVKKSDTLIFSGLLFKSKRVIISDKLMNEKLLNVTLDLDINQLDEVIINKKLNPISGGSQKYVDTPYFDDAKSSPKNQFIYDGTITNGVNFVRLFSEVAKIFKKKKGKKTISDKVIDFPEFTLEKIKYSFFTTTLNLKEEEIKLFLVYCENDVKTKSIIESKSDFELIDFLIIKAIDFKEIKFEK